MGRCHAMANRMENLRLRLSMRHHLSLAQWWETMKQMPRQSIAVLLIRMVMQIAVRW
jgi:hypothetical protein